MKKFLQNMAGHKGYAVDSSFDWALSDNKAAGFKQDAKNLRRDWAVVGEHMRVGMSEMDKEISEKKFINDK